MEGKEKWKVKKSSRRQRKKAEKTGVKKSSKEK